MFRILKSLYEHLKSDIPAPYSEPPKNMPKEISTTDRPYWKEFAVNSILKY